MGRSQESFNKKEVRKKKEKKRQDKEKKRLARRDGDKKGGLDSMIAYVDENGMLTDTPPDPSTKTKTKIEDIEVSVPKMDDSMKPDPIRRGRLTFYNDSKGYGFIRDAVTQESIFVSKLESIRPRIKRPENMIAKLRGGNSQAGIWENMLLIIPDNSPIY